MRAQRKRRDTVIVNPAFRTRVVKAKGRNTYRRKAKHPKADSA
jgi:stalled ribosome alternative rescue factor ArfA